MTDDRLRDLLRRSHEADALPPGFAATVRAARAAQAAPPRRRLLPAAAAMAVVAIAVAGWLASRDRDPDELVAPSFELAGPFDQLPSPFPGLAVADLTLDGAGQPAVPEGLPIEDPW